MPEVSGFLGIIIRFYYNEHLPPHFHAEYNEHQAQLVIGSHTLLRGNLPGRVIDLVQDGRNSTAPNCSTAGNRLGAGRCPTKSIRWSEDYGPSPKYPARGCECA